MIDALATVFDGQADLYVHADALHRQHVAEVEGPYATHESAYQELAMYVEHLNGFANQDGFVRVLERVEALLAPVGGDGDDEASLPSLLAVHWICYLFAKVVDNLTPEYKAAYTQRLRAAVCGVLLSRTEEQLQHEDRKTVMGIVEQLGVAVGDLVPFRFELANKCLHLGLLDKRLLGLQLMCDVVAEEERDERLLANSRVAPLLVQAGVIEYLYGPGVHSELLARCAELPVFLAHTARLTEAHIDAVWTASVGQHESIAVEVYKSVAALAKELEGPLREHLQAKLASVTDVDAAFLNMVQSFGPFGLELLWKLSLGGGSAPALDVLAASFGDPAFHAQRPVYMERCVHEIAAGSDGATQASQLLVKMVLTYPVGTLENQDGFVVQWLHSRYRVLELVVQDVARYQAAADRHWREQLGGAGDPNVVCFRGRHAHHEVVKTRIELLGFLLAKGAAVGVTLSSAQLDVLWQCMVVHALSPWELAQTFAWWCTEGLLGPEGSAHVFAKFTDEAAVPLFRHPGSFACFQSLFVRCNQHAGLVNDRTPLDRVLGVGMLWRVALELGDDAVAREACELLVKTQKRCAPDYALFINQCLDQLERCRAAGDLAKAQRCTGTLQLFLTELRGRVVDPNAQPFAIKIGLVAQPLRTLTLDVYPHTTVGEVALRVARELQLESAEGMRVIAQGHELKYGNDTMADHKVAAGSVLHFMLPSAGAAKRGGVDTSNVGALDASLSPAYILSHAPYFDRLYALLDAGDFSKLVWTVVEKLPLNRDAVDVTQLPERPSHRLYYSLAVLEELVQPRGDDAPVALTTQPPLPQLLAALVQSAPFTPVALLCIHALLAVLKTTSATPAPPVLLAIVRSVCEQPGAPEQQADAAKCCAGALDLYQRAVAHTPAAALLEALYPLLEPALLLCPNAAVRSHVCDAALALCGTSSLASALAQRLFALLPVAGGAATTAAQYFYLADKLVAQLELPFEFDAIALSRSLCAGIMGRATLEQRFDTSTEDQVLQGYMRLLATFSGRGVSVEQAPALVDHLMSHCLFASPSLADHGPLAPPTCKRRTTRRLALALLAQVGCSPALLERLSELTWGAHSRLPQPASPMVVAAAAPPLLRGWAYLPSALEKDRCGYVGLKNQGATCYMNSFMQNLYMQPEFRQAVLRADVLANQGEPDLAKNFLFQLQAFFGHLQESELRAYDTQSFVECYPLNPLQQQDVDE